METKIFDKLREHFGSHKAAAAALKVSYTRYNEWRWRPHEVPKPMIEYMKLFVDRLQDSAA